MTRAAMAHRAYLDRSRFPHLDGLRACCILPVIFHHAGSALLFGRVSERGFLGVDMFFAVSGFLIVTLLLREQAVTRHISLFDFYMRRTLRIMPLYYGIILLCTGLYSAAPKTEAARAFFADLPAYLTYTSNWWLGTGILLITWSLAAEEQFYLVWPLIQKYTQHPVRVVLALLFVSQVIHLGFADVPLAYLGKGPDQLKMLRQVTFTPILSGVLLAYVLHSERGFTHIYRLVGGRYAPLLLSALLLLSLELLPADLRGWPRLWIHVLLPLLLASIVVRTDHRLAPVLSWGPMQRIGVLSYGMYLWHVLALEAANRGIARAQLSERWLFPLTLLLTYGLAELSYRYYESYFLRLKAQFQRQSESVSVAAATPLLARSPSASLSDTQA